jgi:hypothetical protein
MSGESLISNALQQPVGWMVVLSQFQRDEMAGLLGASPSVEKSFGWEVKSLHSAGPWSLTPVILATQEAEIRSIKVRS